MEKDSKLALLFDTGVSIAILKNENKVVTEKNWFKYKLRLIAKGHLRSKGLLVLLLPTLHYVEIS